MHPLTLDDNHPMVNAAREAEQRLLYHYGLQTKTTYVMLPGENIRLRILEIGNGEPLIIVPGNTGDVYPIIPLLAEIKDRRIIAINRPGGGLSEGMDHNTVEIRSFAVKTLETVIDHFQLKNADVVAHSMGAHWSLWLAMDRPQLLRCIIMLGNPGNVMKGKPPLAMRLMVKWPFTNLLFKKLVPDDKSQSLQPLKAMGHTDETIANLPDEMADCAYYFRHLPHYRISFISLLQNAPPNIDEQQIDQVKQPVLFLLGTNDNFLTIQEGRRISATFRRSKFHAIEGAGHLPWLDSAAVCGAHINRFLAKEKLRTTEL